MIVYRIERSKWAGDLSGEGSRLNGGRWNHIGIPAVYTSENRALALLEYSVNINLDNIPRSLVLTTIKLPDDILDHPISALPGNWKECPAPASTKDCGTHALRSLTHPILRFPSIILPQEFNYVLNPLHAAHNHFEILRIEDFIYDTRLKKI